MRKAPLPNKANRQHGRWFHSPPPDAAHWARHRFDQLPPQVRACIQRTTEAHRQQGEAAARAGDQTTKAADRSASALSGMLSRLDDELA